jgi:UDP-GlcNAc:undecaprenyl-phosphate GlcNAc-1-phosphate transferase
MLMGLLAAAEFVPDAMGGGGRPLSVDVVLEQYIWVFYASFLVSFVFTPVMRVVANFYQIIDQPDRVRKMHNVPVAYLGGMAVFLGWLTGLAISQFRRMPLHEPGLPIHVTINFSIVAGACVIIVIGLWDDVFGIKPWMKIAGQVGAASLLLAENIGTRCTGIFFDTLNHWLAIQQEHGHWMAGSYIPHIPGWVTYLTSSVVVVLVVEACCNAKNLMDRLDGHSGGVTAVIAGGFLFLAVHLAI